MKKFLKKIKHGIDAFIISIEQVYFSVAGNKVECNLCHYKANRLKSTRWHLYCHCPRCSSEVRQRLIWATLNNSQEFSLDKLVKGKDVLHFAPEKSMSGLLKQYSGTYKTADLLAEGYSISEVDYNIDISSMPEIKNESFDLVIACDVLEHVPNHTGAMKEAFRILKPGGYCLFTIPQKDNLEKTFEDASITDRKEREKVFGQWDHLRIYGADFPEMLAKAGFVVTVVDETFFDKSLVEKNVLFPPVLSKHPLATNYRKVFFGKKV